MPSCLRSIVLSCYRAIVPSCYRTIVPSCLRALVLSCYRAIVPSCYRAFRSILIIGVGVQNRWLMVGFSQGRGGLAYASGRSTARNC